MLQRLETGDLQARLTKSEPKGIDTRQADRILRLLDRLDAAIRPEDMNLPSITFRFEAGDAVYVNLEDYH